MNATRNYAGRLWGSACRVAVAGAMALSLSTAANAAPLTFGTVQNIGANTASLTTPGNQVVVTGIDIGGTGGSVAGITFVGGNIDTGAFTYSGANLTDRGDATFNSILNTADFNGVTPPTLSYTLTGLTIGAQYAVQLFVVDERNPAGTGRTQDFTAGNTSGLLDHNTGQYVIATFTADATTQLITANGVGSSVFGQAAILNALVLRQVVPEVNAANAAMPLAAVGLVLLLMMDRKKRVWC